MFNWLPYKDQKISERKLTKVMRRLKIEHYNFNWDRNSCYIEFRYHGHSYKMGHSVERAKKKGIILRNGLDCLSELVDTLENLCEIVDRGTYKLETWISSMQESNSLTEDMPAYEEEFHIRYKSVGKQKQSEFNENADFIPAPSHTPPLQNFENNRMVQYPERK
ncbi:hypothetical protein SAMN05192534_10112 [Alteribacillus persepolensis]|uniref:Uncharacterized protein n=1 Tax=Alteribacillus persepolensis TaxID=568899 RepID=A0A1G7Y6Y8_9BACI|nr:hypothetical protein [Alteribacillus persepolensis]SDG92046.1 hypothetical protein SAMN05192534_10112 [Alteribacillus persepolensis]